ncbi:hypothetical protein C8F01DRAFT_359795 [Mycena amicta]|nr:hypothetical protein C8F01DRAFT_359795 [Mycena amicta]
MPRANPSAVIEISDSDSDACAPPPTSSQPRYSDHDFIDLDSDDDLQPPLTSSQRASSETTLDIVDSEDELPPMATLQSAAQSRTKEKGKRKRDSSPEYDSSDMDTGLDESPPKVQRKASTKGRARKTDEQKAVDKERKQQEVERKKKQKAAEKAHKAARVAAAKQLKKDYQAVNKLVGDKKATLVDMEIVFPAIFREATHRPLYDAFRKYVDPFDMTVTISQEREVRGLDVFSWIRTKRADYDVAGRQWIPVKEYTVKESTVAVYLEAAHLVKVLTEGQDGAESGRGIVQKVRTAFNDPRVQIFFVVNGMTAFVRKSATHSVRVKDTVERAVASLQMAEGVHFLYTDSISDAVERLYDLSADLGIKPHKLIERSHLHFCADTDQRSGKSLADTWLKMVQQVHRMTESGGEGIVERFPTPRSLLEAYERAPSQRVRDDMVAPCTVKHRKDGQLRKNDAIGPALSSVVGTVMWERDPLALVTRGMK